ncbi:MAG TPA: hypothetical protein VFF68_00295, partial [Anaerolineaceae bacterium]|nr:hypothetical protein [Anaerolineaceae bacterium]
MNDSHRSIDLEIDIPAPIGEVWKAWTTRAGIRSFFAPDGNVDLLPDGLYEIFFMPEAEPGMRGADG